MSVYTTKTTTSILKNYVPANRDKIKAAINNKVRFELLHEQSLRKCLENIISNDTSGGGGGQKEYRDYVAMLKDDQISDRDFRLAIQESRECVELLRPKFTDLAHALISLNWLRQTADTMLAYQTFLLDLLSAHNKYTQFAVQHLISYFRPISVDQYQWTNGVPSVEHGRRLAHVHELLAAVIEVIPLSQPMVLDALNRLFPHYVRPTFEFVGFVHNLFWLNEYWPHKSGNQIISLIVSRLMTLDVNTPRNEIEAAEFAEDDDDGDDKDDDDGNDGDDDDDDKDNIFQMDMDGDGGGGGNGVKETDAAAVAEENEPMKNEGAETLDLCMEKLFVYIESQFAIEEKSCGGRWTTNSETFKFLLTCFERIILPTHNSHHVQFVLFYYCSFKVSVRLKGMGFFLAERR